MFEISTKYSSLRERNVFLEELFGASLKIVFNNVNKFLKMRAKIFVPSFKLESIFH